ncbi:hypothetical protein ABZY31_28495 [Streptomyces sp. NPDC006529]|uniref:hypothetical protein n=1 Tax=Streptomyces sp. NPDC006529 TaxID=3157177 RepID=UPI0033ABE89E
MGLPHKLSGAARVSAWLGICACLLGSAPAGGGDGDALRLAVSTNGVPAPGVQVRSGQQLLRLYHLRNLAEYGLENVEVRDPQVVGGTARCPSTSLAPLGTMTCRATLPALAGRHTVRVAATGVPAWEGYHSPRASAPAGYDAHASTLTLLRSASQKRLSYRLAYAGPADLEGVRLRDPLLLTAGPLTCSTGPGLPRRLPAGAGVECWATAPARPGRYESVAVASGTTPDRAVSPTGSMLPPLALTAEASAAYSVPAPPPPPAAPRPAAPVPPPGSPRPPGGSPPRGTAPGTSPPRGPSGRTTPPRGAARPGPGSVPAPAPGAPPRGARAQPPGNAPGAAADAAAGAAAGVAPGAAAATAGVPFAPGVAAAPGTQFLAAGPGTPAAAAPPALPPAAPAAAEPPTGPTTPSGTGPVTPPATPPTAPPPSAPAARRPPGTALSDVGPPPRREPLADSLDWAFITLLIVLFPALLAAMSSTSRTSKRQDEGEGD